MNRPLSSTATLCATLALGACASQTTTADRLFGLLTPYRMEIVQGNVVTQEQIALVTPGMTRRQVRDLLGSPMLTDLFHADRWDYPFIIRRQGAEPQQRVIVVHFQGDSLLRVEAPALPNERDFVASITKAGEVPERKLVLTDEERKALPTPPPREPQSAEPTGPARSYPPLEGS